ncbi:MAG: thioredoxin-disulfide reductase [Candidatus Omnitrophica bacterium]|nr:thioredoxin-disulfide reductase [Candidatus Omnitrophota bacterium]
MHDLIIIGAGPAGLTAALYAGRFRMNTLIFEKMACGGQIILSPQIENYPGFPGGISTFELADKFKKQVEELAVTIEDSEVTEIGQGLESGKAVFNVKTQNGNFQAKSIIIASGAQAKKLGVKGEDKFIGRGISYCGTCDGPLFKNKDIAVIGGGDRALEDAIFLTSYAAKVYLIHRRAAFRGSKILEEKVRANPKIDLILDSVVEEISGRDKVEALKVKNLKANSSSEISCQGVFIFVGIEPNTAFLKNLLEMDEHEFIITDEEMRSSKDGIFACGDCRKKSLYQVVTACADGAIAANAVHKYLLNQ